MRNILTLNKISKSGLKKFSDTYNLSDNLENPDAIIVRSASLHEMEFNSNLIAIARAGAGVNNIPIERCTENGVAVFNTPGANANAVKELVLMGLFLASRKVSEGIEWVKTLKCESADMSKAVEKGKSQFKGPEILGKKLGVIGLGAIGTLVANSANALGMEVYGYDPYISVSAAWGLSNSVKHAKSIDDIFTKCDYITLHIPLNNDTKDMINEYTISKMVDGVRVLNYARAGLVNNEDLIKAVKNGKISCYVTDFPNENIIGIDGIITIPHLGASTPESEDNCAVMAALELIDYIENGNIKNSVNLPELVLKREKDCSRICVIHKNIPKMLSQITGILSSREINIENMLSKSKNNIAYAIIDISSKASDEVFSEIKSLDGIIKIRII